jgi:hypothetical protein
VTDKHKIHVEPLPTKLKSPATLWWVVAAILTAGFALLGAVLGVVIQKCDLFQEKMQLVTELTKQISTTANSIEDKLDMEVVECPTALNMLSTPSVVGWQKEERVTSQIFTLVEMIKLAVNLRELVESGKSFKSEISLLQEKSKVISGEEKKIISYLNSLLPYAADGMLTIADLQQQFSQDIDKYLVTITPSATGLSFLSSQAVKFIKVRKVSGKGEGLVDVIARVEQALKKGDLHEAIKQVEELKMRNEQVAVAWLARAAELQSGHKAAGDLYEYVTSNEFVRIIN